LRQRILRLHQGSLGLGRRLMSCPEFGSRPSTGAGTCGPARVVPARNPRDTLDCSSILPLFLGV
jgi:hypothetical protein